MPDTDGNTKRGRRKKEKQKISLWINQTPYVFGCLCTFCQKQRAIVHCPDCKDFYCMDCDGTTHAVEKRKGHIRSQLSKLDLPTASGLVTRCVRYAQHHLELRRRARATIRRFFDRRSLCHYYYNPVYGTVSWRKPYCIRLQDLFPFLDEYRAACWIQGMYHMWYARYRVVKLLKKYYKKVFDRARGLFYYSYHGTSSLMPRQTWRKSVLFGRRGFPYDILPIFTRDVAAVTIQRKWRACLIRTLFCNLVRVSYVQEWDPLDGSNKYLNLNTRVMENDKPKLLRNQPWDPHYVPEWSADRVSLFFRRIGLKQYAKIVQEYGIDGSSALMLDGEDFDNMNIKSKIHRRKIEVELRRVYNPVDGLRGININAEHKARREKIRKAKIYKESSTKIQRVFRGYRARVDVRNQRDVIRVMTQEAERASNTESSKQWWLERTTAYRLPPVKEYGRRRDHLSTSGWGRWDPGGVWRPLESKDEDGNDVAYSDSNASRKFTEGLHNSGYDEKRYQILRGNAVFSSKPVVDPLDEARKERERLEAKIKAAEEPESDEENHGLMDHDD